jgi:hypothetical protein
MVENPLAFKFSKTRTICDAFDEAWAVLQGLGSDLTEPSNALATQTILAKRIIEMVDQGLRDIPALRDDALAFPQHSPPSASRNGLGEAIRAQTAPLPIPKLLRYLAAKPPRATKVEPVQTYAGDR